MAKFDTAIKPKKKIHVPKSHGWMLGAGITMIVLSVIILGLSLYEAFLGGGRIRMVELPGFAEVKLESPGLYAGVYQHRGAGPLPVKALTQMEVHIMSKEDYQEIPVLMNSSGQTFDRLGVQGLPVFNFIVEQPGSYTISGVYNGDTQGPAAVPIMLIPQTAGNIKQTLFVGVGFFILFLVLGIFLLVKRGAAAAPVPPKQ